MTHGSFYRVNILGASGSAPGDGFITNLSAEDYLYMANGANSSVISSLDNYPTAFTLANSTAISRANSRYLMLTQQIGLVANGYITNIQAANASDIVVPTGFQFDVYFEQGDSSLRTWDELNPGVLITNAINVIERMVSRALIQNVTVQAEVLDPTANATFGTTTSIARYGLRYESLSVGPVYANLALANAAITVTTLLD